MHIGDIGGSSVNARNLYLAGAAVVSMIAGILLVYAASLAGN